MPGPRPKPTYLKILTGNPGKRALNVDEPEPDGDLDAPPPALPAKAQAIWREIIGHAPPGLLKRLDTYALEMYCQAVSLYRDARERVEQAGPVIKVPGGHAKNPFLLIQDQQFAIIRSLSDQLGFSPAARTRVKVSGKKKAKSALGKLRELKID